MDVELGLNREFDVFISFGHLIQALQNLRQPLLKKFKCRFDLLNLPIDQINLMNVVFNHPNVSSEHAPCLLLVTSVLSKVPTPTTEKRE
jgi:hypothetical protein